MNRTERFDNNRHKGVVLMSCEMCKHRMVKLIEVNPQLHYCPHCESHYTVTDAPETGGYTVERVSHAEEIFLTEEKQFKEKAKDFNLSAWLES